MDDILASEGFQFGSRFDCLFHDEMEFTTRNLRAADLPINSLKFANIGAPFSISAALSDARS